jgi:hypothetical protein
MSVLKNNLSAHGSVAKRFKILTYDVYDPLFHRFAPWPEPILFLRKVLFTLKSNVLKQIV